ncbi:MAG: hypothetical protein JNL49_07790 [Bacteroidia bacterium]|nr:hypothetical protein [Bacteroidia bacterium]
MENYIIRPVLIISASQPSRNFITGFVNLPIDHGSKVGIPTYFPEGSGQENEPLLLYPEVPGSGEIYWASMLPLFILDQEEEHDIYVEMVDMSDRKKKPIKLSANMGHTGNDPLVLNDPDYIYRARLFKIEDNVNEEGKPKAFAYGFLVDVYAGDQLTVADTTVLIDTSNRSGDISETIIHLFERDIQMEGLTIAFSEGSGYESYFTSYEEAPVYGPSEGVDHSVVS